MTLKILSVNMEQPSCRGLEMMRAVHEENAEEDRKQQVVNYVSLLYLLRTGGDHPYF